MSTVPAAVEDASGGRVTIQCLISAAPQSKSYCRLDFLGKFALQTSEKKIICISVCIWSSQFT